MPSQVYHESACVIPHQSFSVFLVWNDEVTFYFLSYLNLGPQAFCVICFANILIAPCFRELIPGPFINLSDYD